MGKNKRDYLVHLQGKQTVVKHTQMKGASQVQMEMTLDLLVELCRDD